MEESNTDYHTSFFKPTTPQSKSNRNMVLVLVAIWFVAIFGFHFLLRILEKPTPEPALEIFETSWQKIEDGSATNEDVQLFGSSVLTVLCKVAIQPGDKLPLANGLSWSLYQLTTDTLREEYLAKIEDFEKVKASINNITDPSYIESKTDLAHHLGSLLNISSQDIRLAILPLEVSASNSTELTDDSSAKISAVMQKYLIHNRSVLTDTRFLGFPFHYFYTAVFLLILFVGLCWLYCVRTDQLNAKFNVAD